ncbi:MAG: hypothetical protein JWN56_792 [Sphingobacteriales bacterium]|nr:hypothetical protein [Sphingobacteriales bacterium]
MVIVLIIINCSFKVKDAHLIVLFKGVVADSDAKSVLQIKRSHNSALFY